MPARLIKKLQNLYATVEKKQKKLQATVDSSIREAQGYTLKPENTGLCRRRSYSGATRSSDGRFDPGAGLAG